MSSAAESRSSRPGPRRRSSSRWRFLLVPSVLLMIAAGLLANIDRLMAGF